jgi:hypothetical protein
LELIAECQASGKPLRLQVTKENRAIHLYERLGFSKTGEDELHYRMSWEPTNPPKGNNRKRGHRIEYPGPPHG